jgi:hypothetical protein
MVRQPKKPKNSPPDVHPSFKKMAHIPGFRYQAAEGPTTMVRLRLPSNGLLEIAVSTQLLEASSRLFRQHREDTMDCDDAVFDVSTAAHVTPTAIDTFFVHRGGPGVQIRRVRRHLHPL